MTVVTAARAGKSHPERRQIPHREQRVTERVTVFWQGKEYDAIRSASREAQSASVWQVSRDGSPVTTFTAEPGEGALAVKEKIIGWLEGNSSRPTLDVGRQ